MKKIVYLLLVISIGFIFSGCGKKNQTDGQIQGDSSSITLEPLGEKVPFDLVKDSNTKGPNDAKISIVDFSDFQCPACGQMSKVLDQIQIDFPNDVRIVYRHFPLSFHQYAMPTAYASEAAGLQGKFWEMHDAIFSDNINSNYKSAFTDSKIIELAKGIGLNIDQFNKDRSKQEIIQKVNNDLTDGNDIQIDATPTFYFNNQKYQGDYSLQAMENVVKDLLAK